MGQVEKHPSDEGRYQSTVDEYGHGLGNGKSRSAVYKHLSNLQKEVPVIEIVEEIPDEISLGETVQNPDEFDTISWLEPEDSEVPSSTIPAPIRKMASGDASGLTEAQRVGQDVLLRWGWNGLDRGLTIWGRAVTGKEEFAVKRSPQDYDALTTASVNLMDSYGISVAMSPGLVFGIVVTSAYGPPIVEIVQNTDPSYAGRIFGSIKGVILSPFRLFRRMRGKGRVTQNEN